MDGVYHGLLWESRRGPALRSQADGRAALLSFPPLRLSETAAQPSWLRRKTHGLPTHSAPE